MDNNKFNAEPDFGKKLNEEFSKIKQEIQKPNVLIAGATGVGKSSLINYIFGDKVAEVGTGKPVTQKIDVYESDSSDVRIFDSKGYELGMQGDEDFYNNVVNLAQATNNPHNAIHLIWYCIACSGGRVQDYDLAAINAFSKSNIPVAVVFTKADTPSEEEMKAMRGCIPTNMQGNIFETSVIKEEYNQTKELIAWSINKLPESLRFAFVKSQLGNLEEKWEQAHKMIKQHCAAAFTVGFTPIPMSDAPILVANELALIARILYLYNLGEIKDVMSEFAVGSLIDSLLSAGGKAVVGALVKLIPGVGTLVGGLINGSVGAIITAAFGEATSKVAYEVSKERINGGDISDLMKEFGRLVMALAKEYFKAGKTIDEYAL